MAIYAPIPKAPLDGSTLRSGSRRAAGERRSCLLGRSIIAGRSQTTCNITRASPRRGRCASLVKCLFSPVFGSLTSLAHNTGLAGMPFQWNDGTGATLSLAKAHKDPNEYAYKEAHRGTTLRNGVHYASGMPWAARDHWSRPESSDSSPHSLHHRLVAAGATDTASGVSDLCNRLIRGGDSTDDDPDYTAQAGTGWNPGRSAADYIMCDGVVR